MSSHSTHLTHINDVAFLLAQLAIEDTVVVAADDHVASLAAEVGRIERKIVALRQAMELLRSAYQVEGEL